MSKEEKKLKEEVVVDSQIVAVNNGAMKFDKDGHIIEKPKCGVPNCENKGFLFFAGMWVCGDCMHRLFQKEQERQKKLLLESLE